MQSRSKGAEIMLRWKRTQIICRRFLPSYGRHPLLDACSEGSNGEGDARWYKEVPSYKVWFYNGNGAKPRSTVASEIGFRLEHFEICDKPHCQDACNHTRIILASCFYPCIHLNEIATLRSTFNTSTHGILYLGMGIHWPHYYCMTLSVRIEPQNQHGMLHILSKR